MTSLETYHNPTPAATYMLRAKTRTMPESYDESSDPYWAIHEDTWAREVWSAQMAGSLLVEPEPVSDSAQFGHEARFGHEVDYKQRKKLIERQRAVLRDNLTTMMTVLGSLHSWHAALTEQLVAEISPRGGSTFAQREALRQVLKALFRLGVINTLKPSGWNIGWNERAAVWLPGDPAFFNAEVVPLLTTVELASVLGGSPWATPNPAMTRHNVLAHECALRIAEHRRIEHVVGERFARHEHLLPDHVLDAQPGGRAAADAVLVCPTGDSIAIEIVASHGDLDAKMDRWAARLRHTSGLRCQGARTLDVRVVLVLALRRNDSANHGEALRQVRKAMRRAAHRHQVPTEQLWWRLGVVGWPQWFPGPEVGSEDFSALKVMLIDPTGDEHTASFASWEPSHLSAASIDEIQDRRRVLNSIAATPAFLRQPITSLPPHLTTDIQRAFREAVKFRRQGQTLNGIPNVGHYDGGRPSPQVLGPAIWSGD